MGEVENACAIVGILGCQSDNLPSSYLGLSLGAKYKQKFNWEPIVERIEKRLSGWKTKYLSKGVRLTLVKSIFSSIPTYFFLFFPSPLLQLTGWKLFRGGSFGLLLGIFKYCLVKLGYC